MNVVGNFGVKNTGIYRDSFGKKIHQNVAQIFHFNDHSTFTTFEASILIVDF